MFYEFGFQIFTKPDFHLIIPVQVELEKLRLLCERIVKREKMKVIIYCIPLLCLMNLSFCPFFSFFINDAIFVYPFYFKHFDTLQLSFEFTIA